MAPDLTETARVDLSAPNVDARSVPLAGGIRDVVAGGVRSVFQPIVDLDSGAVVAYEALARGPRGALERPDQLFAAARAAGVLAELDAACRAAAFRGAVQQAIFSPLTLFVNVEPEVLDSAPLEALLALAQGAPRELRVVVEITERALAARPAELLRTVDRVRELGWGIALDDVGADAMSLAFMPLLRPDVVKLDLSLVQVRPGPAVAQIMNAVNAYAQSSGALVLAEGIEDASHLKIARALGAQLGQGWMFGRPGPGPVPGLVVGELRLPPTASVRGHAVSSAEPSPFTLLPMGTALRRSPKSLLVELSKQLEREAMRLGDTCVVAATFQELKHFTPATASRYRDLVGRVGFVCALGEGLPSEPLPGLRGAALEEGDPVRGEWDVVVISPHFAAALLARDLGDRGPDAERMFEYALSYDRSTVVAAAHSLLSRVAPRSALDLTVAGPANPVMPEVVAAAPTRTGGVDHLSEGARVSSTTGELLERALAAASNGICIADMTRADQPLVYVNAAFEQLTGVRSDLVLGRNCRFLQGPDTDGAAVAAIRDAIQRGQEWRGVIRNHRGPHRTPWWNEIHLAPVFDDAGRVVQYIGVQNDVTGRVKAERELARERDRSRAQMRRIEELAYTDSLTGLANRRRIAELVEAAVWDARTSESTVSVLFCDLDGFKAVNDAFGHAVGDDLLIAAAGRLRQQVRRGDLLARLGGDEFIVALTALDPASAARHAMTVADKLTEALSVPFTLGAETATVSVSIGVSTYPHDGETFAQLLQHADHEMYARKPCRDPGGASVTARRTGG